MPASCKASPLQANLSYPGSSTHCACYGQSTWDTHSSQFRADGTGSMGTGASTTCNIIVDWPEWVLDQACRGGGTGLTGLPHGGSNTRSGQSGTWNAQCRPQTGWSRRHMQLAFQSFFCSKLHSPWIHHGVCVRRREGVKKRGLWAWSSLVLFIQPRPHPHTISIQGLFLHWPCRPDVFLTLVYANLGEKIMKGFYCSKEFS